MMTMNQMWLPLVLVVSHIAQLVLALKPSCANIMKSNCPSDSFHLEKSSHVLSVLFVVRNWKIKLWFQVSRKNTFTQSTRIYARSQ
jgi:hypothetical protein